jgi:hypothetical protein
MIRIDFAMALRLSLSIASASSNFSNGMGLVYVDSCESELTRLYSTRQNKAKENQRDSKLMTLRFLGIQLFATTSACAAKTIGNNRV